MEKYVIAGLKTEYEVRGELLRTRSEKYKADFKDGEADISFSIPEEYISEKKEKIPYLSWDEHEYMCACEAFYSKLIRHNGIMLHSSCVEKDGYAYLFSARSGTGKSTHTHLWMKNLPNTRIINDDKPALVCENDKWYAYGTPFSGKTDENINTKVPVRALVFLHRSPENKVERIASSEAVALFLSQTINPKKRELAIEMLEILDKLLKSVPVFSLGCNMDDEAAEISYNEIERLLNNEN